MGSSQVECCGVLQQADGQQPSGVQQLQQADGQQPGGVLQVDGQQQQGESSNI